MYSLFQSDCKVCFRETQCNQMRPSPWNRLYNVKSVPVTRTHIRMCVKSVSVRRDVMKCILESMQDIREIQVECLEYTCGQHVCVREHTIERERECDGILFFFPLTCH